MLLTILKKKKKRKKILSYFPKDLLSFRNSTVSYPKVALNLQLQEGRMAHD